MILYSFSCEMAELWCESSNHESQNQLINHCFYKWKLENWKLSTVLLVGFLRGIAKNRLVWGPQMKRFMRIMCRLCVCMLTYT